MNRGNHVSPHELRWKRPHKISMDNVNERLIKCFEIVFPALSASRIPSASQETVDTWDSVATVMLANVVEEEFSIPMDFERLAELNSFDAVRDWVLSEVAKG